MSLLLNNVNNAISNNKTTRFNFEKEEHRKKEIEICLKSFEATQQVLNKKIVLFNLKKEKNGFRVLDKKTLKNDEIFEPILDYIIHVSILKKNTTIQVTNTKGQIKLFCSASFSLKLSGKQKKMQPKVLISLLKHFLSKTHFLRRKDVALHSKYLKKSFIKLVKRRLKKKKIELDLIKRSNFFPHNGCRPKKIKRLKRKRKTKKTKILKTINAKKTWKFLTPRRRRKGKLSKLIIKI